MSECYDCAGPWDIAAPFIFIAVVTVVLLLVRAFLQRRRR